MSLRRRSLLLLLQGGMEASWIFASTAFVTSVLVGLSLSFREALAVFWAAAITGYVTFGRSLRNYLVLLIQALCLAGMLLAVIHGAFYRSQALFSVEWVQAAIGGPHTELEKVEMALIALSAITLWIGGAFLAKRRMAYYSVCSRFDIGLGVFFGLFLVELVIVVKGGPQTGSATALPSLFLFLLLGLLALGVSRTQPEGGGSFQPGYGIAAVFVSFAALVFLSVGAVMLFFLPALQRTAQVSYAVAEKGGNLAAPVAVAILRFLFGPRNMRSDPPSPSTGGLGGHEQLLAPTTWFGHVIEDALLWGLEGLLVAILLLGAAFFIYLFVRWLLSRSASRADAVSRTNGNWLSDLWGLLLTFVRSLGCYAFGRESARTLYRSLQTWGRRSGLPSTTSDTPCEYAIRLGRVYPDLQHSIDVIVEAFNREVYGGMPLAGGNLASARASMEALRNPRFWLRRMKTRLVRPDAKVSRKTPTLRLWQKI
jgi:hypothetical protein